MSQTPVARRDQIDGLGKGLRVIEVFDDEHPRLSASEVAELAGLTRTAARRYLLSLVHFGYADGDGKRYWLTPRVLRLGQSYLSAARLPRLVQPFIQRISTQCGETVNVSVLDGHEVVYVARSNAPRVVSIGFHAGARAPAHGVGPGVVMLAKFSDAALDRWIAEHDFAKFNPNTIDDPKAFRDLIVAARGFDYWMAERQLDPVLSGLSVPLIDRKGECRAAMGMTFASASWDREQATARLLPLLRDAAAALMPLI